MSNSSKMKICYIKNGDVAKELELVSISKMRIDGGHLYYVYSTSQCLKEITKVLFLSFSNKQQRLTINGFEACTIKSSCSRDFVSKFFDFIRSSFVFFQEMKRFRPDYLVCARMRYLFTGYLYALVFKVPFAVSIHTDLGHGKKISRVFERHIFSKAHRLICHGPYLRDQALEITGDSSKIIEYNASCKDISSLGESLPELANKLKDKFIITFIGRMEVQKGVYDLYEACQQLLIKDSSWILCFAGAGPECQGIIKRARLDNLDEQVVVFNSLQRGQVAELLRKTWVAVMPTRKDFPEGRCMAAMEALALGIPVVVPNLGPFPYMVQDDTNGLLYKPNSVLELQEKLMDIQKPSIRNRLAAGASAGAHTLLETNLSYGEAVKQCIKELVK